MSVLYFDRTCCDVDNFTVSQLPTIVQVDFPRAGSFHHFPQSARFDLCQATIQRQVPMNNHKGRWPKYAVAKNLPKGTLY